MCPKPCRLDITGSSQGRSLCSDHPIITWQRMWKDSWQSCIYDQWTTGKQRYENHVTSWWPVQTQLQREDKKVTMTKFYFLTANFNTEGIICLFNLRKQYLVSDPWREKERLSQFNQLIWLFLWLISSMIMQLGVSQLHWIESNQGL